MADPKTASPKAFEIMIESILGGHSPFSHFAKKDQFESSIGIDPLALVNLPSLSATAINFNSPSGLLRPSDFGYGAALSGLPTTNVPVFIINEPKMGAVYAYSANGSVYTTTAGVAAFTALSDAGAFSGGGSQCSEGFEYYDNYIYGATGTDIWRYGPLDGSPIFNSSYWVGTLSKAPLTNTTYPSSFTNNVVHPRHMMHRHSDGKLYIADVVGNQGVLHIISTTKTTVEGDTDAGSTYQKIIFGYGLWPTSIESYGSTLVISFYEGSTSVSDGLNGAVQGKRAKIAFWDTNSQNYNSITWTEFPDTFVSAIRNIDGVLYFTSGTPGTRGLRVSQYIGGYSFKDVYINSRMGVPLPGAVDGDSNALYIATDFNHPTNNSTGPGNYTRAVITSIGHGRGLQGTAIYNIAGSRGGSTTAAVALGVFPPTINVDGSAVGKSFMMSMYVAVGTTTAQIMGSPIFTDFVSPDYSTYTRKWLSQRYKIGRPFKITKIRFPLAQAIAANMIVSPFLLFDEIAVTQALAVINNTNYPGKTNVVIRPVNATGNHSFQIELQWSGSALCVLGLPITIEGEYIDD